ncbi:MAG: hypothetical protein KKB90_13215 [Actinobacteria bacterium]|nr:hypothetical protein [Actinomycetota bacterium]MCG2818360.1 hypothetical protein [Actinomycetes bacterium]MBU4179553.1 hypothetical protein [Actinomycetota bacterium]MBU4219898.1 hypothetical protein [Actinomycetota bacterium]MBU4360069.1 hypothetical protein [Actinomycetota bacterium]
MVSRVREGSEYSISRTITIGGKTAFSPGERVLIHKIDLDVERPRYRYVVYSRKLRDYFQLQESDLVEVEPGSQDAKVGGACAPGERYAKPQRPVTTDRTCLKGLVLGIACWPTPFVLGALLAGLHLGKLWPVAVFSGPAIAIAALVYCVRGLRVVKVVPERTGRGVAIAGIVSSIFFLVCAALFGLLALIMVLYPPRW